MGEVTTTIGSEMARACEALAAAGVETPRLDAELLMCHVTGFTRTQLITRRELPLSHAQLTHFADLLEKRRQRYPLPYIIGVWEFWGMEFEVNPSTLIPRPETEILVGSCVEWLRGKKSTIVDIGTGSGAIAVAVAKELPEARVYATDISTEAAHTAGRNALKNGVADRVEIMVGDLAQPLAGKRLEGQVDAIVSNPPYIAEHLGPGLQPEVQHEPVSATLAGADPLTFYRRILSECRSFLKSDGRIFFEIDTGLSAGIVALANAAGLELAELHNDLAGFERVLVLKCAS